MFDRWRYNRVTPVNITRRVLYCQRCGLPQSVMEGLKPIPCECGGCHFRSTHPSSLSISWKQPPYEGVDRLFLAKLYISPDESPH